MIRTSTNEGIQLYKQIAKGGLILDVMIKREIFGGRKMKKKVWITFSFILLVAIICTTLIVKKPNQSDYAMWVEDTYNVQCLDFNCNAFDFEVTDEGQEKTITMQSIHGGYSPGIFVMKIDRVYRNLEDPSYKLDLEVKGFLGEINVVNETEKLFKD